MIHLAFYRVFRLSNYEVVVVVKRENPNLATCDLVYLRHMTNLSCSNRLSAFLQDEIARESCALRFLVIAILTLCCATLRAQSTPTVSLSVLSAQSMGAIS